MKNPNLSPKDLKRLKKIHQELWSMTPFYPMGAPNIPTRDKPGFEREEENLQRCLKQIHDYLDEICSFRVTPRHAFFMHSAMIDLLDNILFGSDVRSLDLTIDQHKEIDRLHREKFCDKCVKYVR